MRIIDKGPHKSVVKQIICKNCGATIEYVPRDVIELSRGHDMGGDPSGSDGFECPQCDEDIVIRRW